MKLKEPDHPLRGRSWTELQIDRMNDESRREYLRKERKREEREQQDAEDRKGPKRRYFFMGEKMEKR